ncbi:hypothetical protein GCM10028827_31490 [Mucilaginibacter myungsuensis]
MHKDSTFVYNSGIGELVLAEGYWTIQKKELLLMSSSEPLVSFEKVSTPGTTLHVIADPDMPLPGAIINFYKNAQVTKVTSDIRGMALAPVSNPDSIVVQNLGYQRALIIPPTDVNCIDVKLKYAMVIAFDKMLWKVRGKKLIPPRSNNGMKLHYLKKQRSGDL